MKAVGRPVRRYDLPGGNVGRKFVDVLTAEVGLVAAQKEFSERLVVFQFVVLQREARVTKTADIRHLVSKRLDLWESGRFDVLFSEAVRCSETYGRRRQSGAPQQEHEHSGRVFHRLMLQRKLRSAVRWITERDQSVLLNPTDMTKARNEHGIWLT